jgi:hypothetical protein
MLERLLSCDQVKHQCREVAARLDGDDAIGRACEVIEQAARSKRGTSPGVPERIAIS